ncbi:lysozyme inhibitor LprI family protein [Herbaspirillum sp. YR522]|uniref:lysozyme inhibitor LprI family protein n=1 Tax=Herbaspirillum sp. YR522 TaxID=1144342 RepID=UPI00026FB3E6|nr:hypothetical protein [Herbaspirillum sp. YR522]EJM97737.1 hypothetical protein PMI40_04219 [Herbaspirillum sp. YR522]
MNRLLLRTAFITFIALAGIAAASLPCGAAAASFDCRRAGSANEKTICGDALLSAADDRLGQAYRAARQQAADRRAFTAESERQWRWREQNCHDRACLVRWYERRQAELQAPAGTSLEAAVRLPVSAPAALPAPSAAGAPIAAPGALKLGLSNRQIADIAPPGSAPWPHYLRAEQGRYFYEDTQHRGALVSVRYYGVENGQYVIETSRGSAVARLTCSADCRYIALLALPGDVETDTVIVPNDSHSLPSIIVNDARHGLLAVR